jgi:hypothetical protein
MEGGAFGDPRIIPRVPGFASVRIPDGRTAYLPTSRPDLFVPVVINVWE